MTSTLSLVGILWLILVVTTFVGTWLGEVHGLIIGFAVGLLVDIGVAFIWTSRDG